MKKIILFGIIGILSVTGCKERQFTAHYELDGGDPQIDYVDFLNDSICQFVAPGSITLQMPYIKKNNAYIITINGIIEAQLQIVDDKTLHGDAPFFDGVWKKK